MYATWSSALRYWLNLLLGLALAGCGATAQRPSASPDSTDMGPAPCAEFVDAWVGHFRANVAKLDGQAKSVSDHKLQGARQALKLAAVDESRCQRPFCVVQPLAGGRLDSYCGYRHDDPSGTQLYLWQSWAPSRR